MDRVGRQIGAKSEQNRESPEISWMGTVAWGVGCTETSVVQGKYPGGCNTMVRDGFGGRDGIRMRMPLVPS